VYFDTLIQQLKTELPDLIFSVNQEEYLVSIPPKLKGFGVIEIQDDCDEFIIFIGNFTHMHISCHDSALNKQQQAEKAVIEVVEFLADLLTDKIVLWGCAEKGGGFYYPEFSPMEQHDNQWLWSGEIAS